MKNQLLVDLLILNNYKISFAESCTGGLLVSKIVEIPSASKVLDMSFVTYAEKAKVELIGVKQETIDQYGVVSEEVAKEMAIGVANEANSNIGVAVTGIAGPTGGTKLKPVGMVCFGICINNQIFTYTKQFGNIGRTNVREESVKFIINTLVELLKVDGM